MKPTTKPKEPTIQLDGVELTKEEVMARAKNYYARLKQSHTLVLTPKMLSALDTPEYQRDQVAPQVKSLKESMLRGNIIPPILLVYRPGDNGGVSFQEMVMALNEDKKKALANFKYTIIDGFQRYSAANLIKYPLQAVILPELSKKDELTTFCNFQKGRRVNSNHLIAINQEIEENRIVRELATSEDSPLKGCIYLGKGNIIKGQLNASAFVELVRTKILTPSQLKPFAKFYRKLFYPNKLYSGGFKSVAKLYIALVQGGTFNLDNEEHCKVFTSFDWENPAIHPLTHCNGAAGYQPLVDMLVQRWKESGFDA